ncbi:hypothetical protein [Croceicoccus mobilis]|uniref:Uncharacterized protein n=1 Tax=Croceicoccus mobilis TaxID=1703339 RepID=A0A916Z8V7_9SPHN|nr:hypothetical protein [Croceicoccus mobilis]GGD81092.1 hypothetical protein GCM10010990_33800 [Croceicoccus mobilis]
MDNISILWRGLFDRSPNNLERQLMSRLVDSGIDDSYLCLCAIHIHFLVITNRDAQISVLAREMQTSMSRLNDLLPVLAAGLEATINRVEKLEASARYTEQVLATAAQTMAKIDDEHSFWRRLTTAAPLPEDRSWFLVAVLSAAAGGAVLANAGTILALLS